MLVEEMIALLQKQDPKARLVLSIGDPDDTAFTSDVSVDEETEKAGNVVTIRGWVASDDLDACAPWSDDSE
jgi:hypothetical protein